MLRLENYETWLARLLPIYGLKWLLVKHFVHT
jgi:hypothetical protein